MERLRIKNLYFHTMGPVDLVLERSECAGLTGPSGAGKTLFLMAVADMTPYRGNVYLDGDESGSMSGPDWRKRVGLLPSESSWWYDTVGEHFNSMNSKWFSALGFDEAVAEWEISRLSSGERQRFALLRLLSNMPKVLLLDEPTANLDTENAVQVEKLIEAYRIENNSSVIWVGHDINQIKRVSNRCFRMEHNSIIAI